MRLWPPPLPASRYVPLPVRPSFPPIPRKPLPLPTRKNRKYNPWEVDMTLCIAARCIEEETQRSCVVIAHDTRVETNVAGAEIRFKFERLPGSWSALLAGPVDQAQELTDIFRVYLSENEIKPETALEQLRIPARTLRRRLADSLTHKRVSCSYQEFVEVGKEKLSSDVYSQLAYEISQQSIEAELILIGAMRDDFTLFLCRGGEISACQDFAVIGSGSMVAEPVLYQRELSVLSSLEEALYVVYEAKRLGEISPGVGHETFMHVGSMDPVEFGETERVSVGNVDWHCVDELILRSLEEAFKEFGPKPIEGLQLSIVDLIPKRRSKKRKHEKTDDSGASASEGQ